MEIAFRSRWLRFDIQTGRDEDDDDFERADISRCEDDDPADVMDEAVDNRFGFRGRRRG